MSYFDDYIADGLCCECCGVFLGGDEPGFVRRCSGCQEPPKNRGRKKAKRPDKIEAGSRT